MSKKNFGIGLRGAVMLLVLLAAAIGISGALYRQSEKQVQEVSLQEPILETLAVGTQSTEPMGSLQEMETLPLPAMAEPDAEPTAPAAPVVSQPLQTIAPVDGANIGEYAMDSLSYNETTRDWRVHNGLDLAAEPGAPVCAAADGTVYTTYEDDSLGYTVVIRHDGGYTTRYSSLDADLCVAPGDTVTMGQTIGYAGDTALVESVMGSHVHFSVSCQDLPMDPQEFLEMS